MMDKYTKHFIQSSTKIIRVESQLNIFSKAGAFSAYHQFFKPKLKRNGGLGGTFIHDAEDPG